MHLTYEQCAVLSRLFKWLHVIHLSTPIQENCESYLRNVGWSDHHFISKSLILLSSKGWDILHSLPEGLVLPYLPNKGQIESCVPSFRCALSPLCVLFIKQTHQAGSAVGETSEALCYQWSTQMSLVHMHLREGCTNNRRRYHKCS